MRFRWPHRRRSLVCRQAVALIADYLDGTLRAQDVTRLEAHLADCPHCSEYLAQMRVTIAALGQVTPEDLNDDALDELVSLYRQWRSGPATS
jgi:anti-sigma factor RsiW